MLKTFRIEGKAKEGTPDKYWLTIQDGTKDWRGGEVGNTQKILKSKKGKWDEHDVPTNGTTLINDQKNPVILLLDFKPSKIKKPGAKGHGHAVETAREVSWTLMDIIE